MKLIQKMAADTAYAPDAQYYELGAAAAKKLNDAENEKLYLRRNPDTAAYFSTQYEVFAYALRADSAQRALQADKNASTRVSGNYAALLTRLYPNLATASRYFLTKEKWNEAARFAKMTLEVRNAPIFGPRAPQISPALEMQNAEDYLYAGYASGRFDEATRYTDAALRDSLHRSTVLRTLALNYEAAQKQDEFLALLKRGVREYPKRRFSFSVNWPKNFSAAATNANSWRGSIRFCPCERKRRRFTTHKPRPTTDCTMIRCACARHSNSGRRSLTIRAPTISWAKPMCKWRSPYCCLPPSRHRATTKPSKHSANATKRHDPTWSDSEKPRPTHRDCGHRCFTMST